MTETTRVTSVVLVSLLVGLLGMFLTVRYVGSAIQWYNRGCEGASWVMPVLHGDPDWYQGC